MRAKSPILLIIALSAVILSSCLKPSREAGGAKAVGAASGASSDVGSANLSYTTFVQPLFAQYCTSCHSSAGRIPPLLDTYDDVVELADINLETMEGIGPPMPPAGLLDTATVQRYRQWYESGTPE